MTNIIKVSNNDVANGTGLRITVWFAGCSHGCKGCHNQNTWKAHQGKELTQEVIGKIIDACDNDRIAGLTLSGGDPLDIKLKNYEGALELTRRFKERFPNKTVWVWTGELYENLNPEWLKYIDVLIDGEFILEKKDITLKWRGSSNQRIIKLNEIRN